MRFYQLLAFAACPVVLACSSSAPLAGAVDASADAPTDAPIDAPIDAPVDAGTCPSTTPLDGATCTGTLWCSYNVSGNLLPNHPPCAYRDASCNVGKWAVSHSDPGAPQCGGFGDGGVDTCTPSGGTCIDSTVDNCPQGTSRVSATCSAAYHVCCEGPDAGH